MKYLKVTFSDERVFKIPAQFIAENRAAYYAKSDSESGADGYDEIFKEEVGWVMEEEDSFEICDWAFNNMDWKDVKDVAIEDERFKADLDEEWCNVENEIVEE